MTTKGKATEAVDEKWTIKGITVEMKDAVTQAAKKEGITVGEYVNRAVAHFHGHEHDSHDVKNLHDMKDVAHILAAIEKRLAMLEKKPKKASSAKKTLKKITAKIQWRDWLSKGNDALHQAYEYTRSKLSRKGKAKAKVKPVKAKEVKAKEAVPPKAKPKAKSGVKKKKQPTASA